MRLRLYCWVAGRSVAGTPLSRRADGLQHLHTIADDVGCDAYRNASDDGPSTRYSRMHHISSDNQPLAVPTPALSCGVPTWSVVAADTVGVQVVKGVSARAGLQSARRRLGTAATFRESPALGSIPVKEARSGVSVQVRRVSRALRTGARSSHPAPRSTTEPQISLANTCWMSPGLRAGSTECGCPGCGVFAEARGRRLRRLDDVPAFGAPVSGAGDSAGTAASFYTRSCGSTGWKGLRRRRLEHLVAWGRAVGGGTQWPPLHHLSELHRVHPASPEVERAFAHIASVPSWLISVPATSTAFTRRRQRRRAGQAGISP